MKEELSRLIQQALDALVAQDQLPADLAPAIKIDRTRDKAHGDLACNIALTLAKAAGRNPRELAGLICEALPPVGAEVRDDNGKLLGTITSPLVHRDHGPLALCVLRKPHDQAGTALSLSWEGGATRATVR